MATVSEVRSPATAIKVTAAIIHILNSKAGPVLAASDTDPAPAGLVLSDRPLPGDVEPAVFDYIAEHILGSLDGDRLQAARFVDITQGTGADCVAMLASVSELVPRSRKLAERLYQIMAANQKTSPGDLVVCTYDGPERLTQGTRLAVLKLDLGPAFRHETRGGTGSTYVTVVPVAEPVLPTSRQRLQKCAFIRTLDPRHSRYDMLIADRVARPDEVARYFSKRFLGAKRAFTRPEETKTVSIRLHAALKAARPHLAANEVEKLNDAAREVFKGETFRVEEWTAKQALPPEARKQVEGALDPEHLPNRVIQLHKPTALEVLGRPTRYRGDFGLLVEKPAQFPKARFTVVPPKDGHGLTRVTIETKVWEPIG